MCVNRILILALIVAACSQNPITGRKQESEADRMGLIFMAMAGYDPNEAIAFWTRMSKLSAGQQPPQFLSTHPSDQARIASIRDHYLPEALKYYKKA